MSTSEQEVSPEKILVPRPLPPVAPVIPKQLTMHGDTRVDNYYWLKERDNPQVIHYLQEENAYTEAVMKKTETLQAKLYAEMLGRIQQTDLSVPERIGEYYYYSRTQAGAQYPIYCRKWQSLAAVEQILLDQNALAEGKDFCDLGVFEVSPDHNYLAYSVDFSGDEIYRLFIKDLRSGEMLLDEIPNTADALAWANDNKTFFYTTLDAAKRSDKLYRHVLGTYPPQDPLIYHEKDEKFYLSVSTTRSKDFIILEAASQITGECRFLNADTPHKEFQLFRGREYGVEYSLDHRGANFYLLTNKDAINFRVLRVATQNVAEANWLEVVPHDRSVKIEDIDLLANHMVLYAMRDGLKIMQVYDLLTNQAHEVEFPEPVYTYYEEDNPEFHTSLLRFKYTSLVTPLSVFDYDMDKRTRELKKQTQVLGGYDPAQYESQRLFAIAQDGTKIPLSLVYKSGARKGAQTPCLLYAYGSYGANVEPSFSSNRLSLLDRGVMFVMAHIRGGGEMGRPWYEAGKFLHKKNTFTDFIACADYLIANDYTSPQQLSIMGGSAGGLLMGAVSNMRPDLFQGVIAMVPFVDVVTTMLDPSIPLTVIEYDEWGNPNNKEFYDYLKSYSPYDNVTAKQYPNILVTAGLNDPRVQYWEPAKWVAKMRAHKTDSNLLLLKTEMDAGHGGPSGRYAVLKEWAFIYAFLLEILQLNDSSLLD